MCTKAESETKGMHDNYGFPERIVEEYSGNTSNDLKDQEDIEPPRIDITRKTIANYEIACNGNN